MKLWVTLFSSTLAFVIGPDLNILSLNPTIAEKQYNHDIEKCKSRTKYWSQHRMYAAVNKTFDNAEIIDALSQDEPYREEHGLPYIQCWVVRDLLFPDKFRTLDLTDLMSPQVSVST